VGAVVESVVDALFVVVVVGGGGGGCCGCCRGVVLGVVIPHTHTLSQPLTTSPIPNLHTTQQTHNITTPV